MARATYGIHVVGNETCLLNPVTMSVPHHIETSQLICRANQLARFYIMGNIGC